MLSLPSHRGQSAHGHSGDGVGGEELTHDGTLRVTEVESHVFKGSLLRAQCGRLDEEGRGGGRGGGEEGEGGGEGKGVERRGREGEGRKGRGYKLEP